MAGLLDGLQNLPVFEGRPEEDRRRALLEAGLAMMQPQDALMGENPLTQLSGGVTAGLTSLDRTDAQNRAADQQAFQNIITGQQADAATMKAGAAEITANAAATNAGTSASALDQQIAEFDAEQGLRDAKINLDEAQARWLDRRHDGSPAGANKKTQAMIDDEIIKAHMRVIYQAEPEAWTGVDGKPDMARLMVQAFSNLHRQKIPSSVADLSFIIDGGEAEALGENISAIQGEPPPPAGVSGPVTVTGQEDLDAKKASGELKSGDTVIFNGTQYTVD